jgi:hypothetical protein
MEALTNLYPKVGRSSASKICMIVCASFIVHPRRFTLLTLVHRRELSSETPCADLGASGAPSWPPVRAFVTAYAYFLMTVDTLEADAPRLRPDMCVRRRDRGLFAHPVLLTPWRGEALTLCSFKRPTIRSSANLAVRDDCRPRFRLASQKSLTYL